MAIVSDCDFDQPNRLIVLLCLTLRKFILATLSRIAAIKALILQ